MVQWTMSLGANGALINTSKTMCAGENSEDERLPELGSQTVCPAIHWPAGRDSSPPQKQSTFSGVTTDPSGLIRLEPSGVALSWLTFPSRAAALPGPCSLLV